MSCMSMTGFGRANGSLSDRYSASLTIRSVNHRYLDVQVRTGLREEVPEVEAALRRAVSRTVHRGRVIVQVNLARTEPAPAGVLVNEKALRKLLEQLKGLDLSTGEVAPPTLGDLLAVPGLVTVVGEQTMFTEEEVTALGSLAEEALTGLEEMRRDEGRQLVDQIRTELDGLGEFLDWFEPQMATVRGRLLEKLKQRLRELVDGEVSMDGERLVLEAAVLTDRADVGEEVVRLRGHLSQFKKRLSAGGVVGRSLDFLCQEMNRELNTMGSKYRDRDFTERLVDAKSSVEKIREQVQNIE